MKEIWKDLPDYQGLYQASNLGQIRSLDKYIGARSNGLRFSKGRILKSAIASNGYKTVALAKNKVQNTKLVHQLIAMSFLGHKPNGYNIVVDHINNIRTDNRLCNLQLITHRENCSKNPPRYNRLTSKYTGVCYCKKHKNTPWRAAIYINGKQFSLGLFKDEYEAHLEYEKALRNYKRYMARPIRCNNNSRRSYKNNDV